MNCAKKTLLIVDDEPDLREILTAIFELKGYAVLTASNGKDALMIVKEHKVDLVISDIQMPGGNGVEFLDSVRDNHYEVPIVLFMTGFAEISLASAYDKGAEAVFEKPFDQKLLVAVVQRALTPKDVRWTSGSDRLPTNIEVELTFPDLQTAIRSKAINLGRGGMFISLLDKFPRVNDCVGFKIDFASELTTVIEGRGFVKWTRVISDAEGPPGCGVEFFDLSSSGRTQVIELINFLKTKQYIPQH